MQVEQARRPSLMSVLRMATLLVGPGVDDYSAFDNLCHGGWNGRAGEH